MTWGGGRVADILNGKEKVLYHILFFWFTCRESPRLRRISNLYYPGIALQSKFLCVEEL